MKKITSSLMIAFILTFLAACSEDEAIQRGSANFSVEPQIVNFGKIGQGQSFYGYTTLKNSGTSSINITSLKVEGNDEGFFKIPEAKEFFDIESDNATLPYDFPGKKTHRVKFEINVPEAPENTKIFTARVIIGFADAEPVRIDLKADVSPSYQAKMDVSCIQDGNETQQCQTVDLGVICPGNKSELDLKIKNESFDVTLQISKVELALPGAISNKPILFKAPGAEDYVEASKVEPFSVNPEETITFKVKADASNVPAIKPRLYLYTNDPANQPFQLQLQLVSKQTEIEVNYSTDKGVSVWNDNKTSELSIPFAKDLDLTEGQINSVDMKIRNAEECPLIIESVKLDNNQSENQLSINTSGSTDLNSGITLNKGEETTFKLDFDATKPVDARADLVINSNDPDESSITYKVAVDFTPQIGGTTYDFCSTTASEQSFEIELENSGPATLVISDIEIDVSSSPEFSLNPAPSYPLSIGPNQKTKIGLKFVDSDKTAPNSSNIDLIVKSNDTLRPEFTYSVVNTCGF